MKEILRRAMEEGREGRVLMIQQRLEAVRDIPPEHQHILKQLRLYGQIIPEGSIFSSHRIH
jgi:hypothetical protein